MVSASGQGCARLVTVSSSNTPSASKSPQRRGFKNGVKLESVSLVRLSPARSSFNLFTRIGYRTARGQNVRAYPTLEHGGERDEKSPCGCRRPFVQEQDLRDRLERRHRGGVPPQFQKIARSPSRVATRPARPRPQLRPLRAAHAREAREVRRNDARCPYGRLPLPRPERPGRRRAGGRLRPRPRPQCFHEGFADWELAGVAISRSSSWTLTNTFIFL